MQKSKFDKKSLREDEMEIQQCKKIDHGSTTLFFFFSNSNVNKNQMFSDIVEISDSGQLTAYENFLFASYAETADETSLCLKILSAKCV